MDATGSGDLCLVIFAFLVQIGRVAIQDVCVFRLDVNVLEKVLPHERVVTLWVVPLQTCAKRQYEQFTALINGLNWQVGQTKTA